MPDALTAEQIEGLKNAQPHELAFVHAETQWIAKARRTQVIPLDLKKRQMALIMTGRGWGKTHSAGSWARRKSGTMPGSIGHVIAPTFSDLRGTVFEGVSGLLSLIPKVMIETYDKSLFQLKLINGTLIRGFSSEVPDRLRGPQCHWMWGDEVAAWQYLEETLANIDFSTRLVYERADGLRMQPQRVYTTTPRPLEALRVIAEDPEVHQVRGSLYENKDNLAETFIDDVAKHEGTKLGKQEIHGELLNFDDSAIIKKRWLRMWPKNRELPQFEFIFVSFDTALTEETYDKKSGETDYTACTVWGVFLFEKRMNVMLLDSWRERLGMPELIERAREEARKEYGHVEPPDFKVYAGAPPRMMRQPKRPAITIIEDIGSGKSLRQVLEKEKVAMYPYNPGRASKMARLNAVAYTVKGGKEDGHGRVWLIESSESPDAPTVDAPTGLQPKKFVSWADHFIAEVCMYTGPDSTKHDDFVDSFSQAMRYFIDHFIDGSVDDKMKKKQPPAPPPSNPYG